LLLDAPTTPQMLSLSLHDALPISLPAHCSGQGLACYESARSTPLPEPGSTPAAPADAPDVDWPCQWCPPGCCPACPVPDTRRRLDRKSTRLNSSHVKISYAVFCLK